MTGFITLFTTMLGIIFIANDIGLGGITIELSLGSSSENAGAGYANPAWASQFASLTIYLVLLKYFVQPFSQIANVLNIFQAALAGANRAFEVFNEQEEMNPLEKIVINIAGSNLPIQAQKEILQEKLMKYKLDLTELECQLKRHPKRVKKEDIR